MTPLPPLTTLPKNPKPEIPSWLWRSVIGSVIASAAIIIGVAGAIYFTPDPFDRVWQDTAWLETAIISLPPNPEPDIHIREAAYALPKDGIPFRVELAARLTGDESATWGIWWQVENTHWLLGVNLWGEQGYATARHCKILDTQHFHTCDPITYADRELVWQSVLYLVDDQENRITLEYVPNRHVIVWRINNEWFADLPMEHIPDTWGVWWQSGTETDATLRFTALEGWQKVD